MFLVLGEYGIAAVKIAIDKIKILYVKIFSK